MAEIEQESYLLSEIITITNDSNSKNFWLKAIEALGEDRVEMELGELKYQMRTGHVEHPAKYLTTLLQKQMKQTSAPEQKKNTRGEKLKTYFETTQIQLFTDLRPIKPKGEVEQQEMVIPYGKKRIPWTTFLSSSFFTLSTNKAKSDKVVVKFRTLDGQTTVIPMLRGKLSPQGKEWGILTAQHAKILAALKNIWAQQGCSYNSYPNGAKICSCSVSARELAKLLGWTKFSGSTMSWLKDMVYALKVIPYYLDLSGLGIKDITGYGFGLLNNVTLMDGKKHGQDETVFHIEFSVPLSVQLINRHAVTKSMDMLTVRTELATLLRLYLEPILIGLNGKEYSKQLKDLILDLQLPKASWHLKPFHRKRMFEKIIKEINGQYISDNGKLIASVEKGLYDYVLLAQLMYIDKAMG